MDRNDRNDCMQRLAFLWNCSHASLRHSTQLSGFYIYRIKQLASQFGIVLIYATILYYCTRIYTHIRVIMATNEDLTPDMESMLCPCCHCMYIPATGNLRIISKKKMKKLQQKKANKLSICNSITTDEKTKNYVYIKVKCTTCNNISYRQHYINSGTRSLSQNQDYSSSANELKTPTSSHNRNSTIAVSSISKSAKKRSMIRHSLLTSMLKASAASTPQSSPSLKDFLMST
ncbi:hypothetical protein TrispH2_008954 [Trichoplax sp. H2]|nr:hypothetical protein TrispH2_008954 [Trichoplax sp. H2]|eukprot:RDD39222.1 hypothetical protein TrispH2_008954 [Trichoplax sp. H2]